MNFGLSNHMYIVGHTLVWHGQTPSWVFAGTNPPPGITNAPPSPVANTNAAGTNAPGVEDLAAVSAAVWSWRF